MVLIRRLLPCLALVVWMVLLAFGPGGQRAAAQVPESPPAPTITLPLDGMTVPVTGFAVSGTGVSSAVVTLYVDGVDSALVATVGEDGAWLIPDFVWSFGPLPPGGFDLSATQRLAPESPPSPLSNIVHVSHFHPAPVITLPLDGMTVPVAGFAVSGTGVSSAIVTLYVDGVDSGVVATVGEDGAWVIPDFVWSFGPLPPGGFDLSATQRLAPESPPSPLSNIVHVSHFPPAPAITNPLDGTVLASTSFAAHGTGTPGMLIEVRLNGLANGQFTTVQPDGQWSILVIAGDVLGTEFELTMAQRLSFADPPGAPSNVVRLTVQQAGLMPDTLADCMKGGWRAHGVFKNQGDCVSWVATKGRNPPAY